MRPAVPDDRAYFLSVGTLIPSSLAQGHCISHRDCSGRSGVTDFYYARMSIVLLKSAFRTGPHPLHRRGTAIGPSTKAL